MNCSNCGTEIPLNERFCRNCGHEAIPLAETIHASGSLEPTLLAQPSHRSGPAAETARLWTPTATSTPSDTAPVSTSNRRSPLFIPLIIVLILLGVGAVVTVTYLLLRDKAGSSSVATGQLPDHFGIFIQNGDGLSELRRMDFRDAIKGRDELLGDASLPRADARPSLILYSEPQDIPTSDLKLVQLDGIDPSGSVRYLNYQVAPLEGGRRGMKQIKVPAGLASGKYAFALFKDYLNEGSHRFWPFQVTEGVPASSAAQPQVTAIQVKAGGTTASASPRPSPTSPAQRPTASPPPAVDGGQLAYCNDDNVILRATPSLNGPKVNKLMRGQRVWVIGKSANVSSWGGVTANWAHVQLYDRSQTGWVFSPFISY